MRVIQLSFLAKLHNANVLLGSATPSFESYYNAKKGKFSLVEIKKRFNNLPLPEIHCVDIRKAHLKKQMISHLSPFLLRSIQDTLDNKKQIILFQNRRGYSLEIRCNTCSHIFSCKYCDISLTLHKYNDCLKCHYCGYKQDIPSVCPSCNNNDLLDKGFGTEQIEDELKNIFPAANCKRMDYDTTRARNDYHNIITNFEDGKIDILVGTQMITKGLDFDNVEIVGILNADNMLFYPDFRAYERAFQLMLQVSGRSGRKKKQGNVIIQTFDKEHRIFKLLLTHNYQNFFNEQIQERSIFEYPPFTYLISIILKDRDIKKIRSTGRYTCRLLT